MANDRSTHVGCCSSQYYDGEWYWFMLVCNYAQNNIQHYATYKFGPPCSQCKNGCDSKYKALCTLKEPIDPKKVF